MKVQKPIRRGLQSIMQIQAQIDATQNQIAVLQEDYLAKTSHYGNILIGFQDYLVLRRNQKSRGRISTVNVGDRMFSLSSMTSQASKNYNMLQKNMKQKVSFPSRITRSAIRNVLSQQQKKDFSERDVIKKEVIQQKIAQQKKSQKQSSQEWSIDRSINRQGSYHRNHKPLKQAFKDYYSQGSQGRTISFDDHFYSQTTQNVCNDFNPKMKKKKVRSQAQKPSKKERKQQLMIPECTQSVPIEQTDLQQRIEEISPQQQKIQEDPLLEQVDQMNESDDLQEFDSDSAAQEIESDEEASEDSVDRFIQIARKLKI